MNIIGKDNLMLLCNQVMLESAQLLHVSQSPGRPHLELTQGSENTDLVHL